MSSTKISTTHLAKLARVQTTLSRGTSTLMLLLAYFYNTKWCKKKAEKWLKLWHMATHLRVFAVSYPMNTNITGFRWFSKSLHPCALDESPCRIGSLSKHGRPCSDHGWNMVKEHGQGTWSTMFQTSTLNGHHCQNMVETRSSDHVLIMVETCSSDHVLTMVRIDYGQPWFDHGGHLTLMFKT